jgi:hypothetical protein
LYCGINILTGSATVGAGRPHMRPMSAAQARTISAYATTDPTVGKFVVSVTYKLVSL